MKKIVCLLISFCVIFSCFAFAGCGSNNDNKGNGELEFATVKTTLVKTKKRVKLFTKNLNEFMKK